MTRSSTQGEGMGGGGVGVWAQGTLGWSWHGWGKLWDNRHTILILLLEAFVSTKAHPLWCARTAPSI
jgi:hypothetical protein